MPHSSGQDRPLGPGVLQRCLRAAVWAPWGMRVHHAQRAPGSAPRLTALITGRKGGASGGEGFTPGVTPMPVPRGSFHCRPLGAILFLLI